MIKYDSNQRVDSISIIVGPVPRTANRFDATLNGFETIVQTLFVLARPVVLVCTQKFRVLRLGTWDQQAYSVLVSLLQNG